MNKKTSDISDGLKMLKCPICAKKGTGKLFAEEKHLRCLSCGSRYQLFKNTVNMLPTNSTDNSINDVQTFWETFFKQRFKDINFSSEGFNKLIGNLREGLEDKEHLLIRELKLEGLENKFVLEIGSGSGAHAALIKRCGANIFAVEVAAERVIATAKNMSFVSEGNGYAIQADAQVLPFEDESFDIVYSNGVLHHAPDTNACIKEVYRVLKPGGKAVIMLYARWALSTLLYIYGKGIMSGLIFKYPEERWMGYVTEGGPIGNSIFNPCTRVYSKKQIRELFSDFREIKIRQSSFRFLDIPRVGKYAYRFLKRIYKLKEYEGGKLASGIPWKQISPIERKLGKYLGNCLNILAIK